MNDFLDYANQWLQHLVDDPSQDLEPPHKQHKSFLDGLEDWTNEQLSDFDQLEKKLNGVSDRDVEAAASAKSSAGFDVLAFYKSFRFVSRPPFCGKWGIFLLDAGIKSLANEILEIEDGLDALEAQRLAKEMLLVHERYHFWIDAWTLGQEIAPLRSPKIKRYEYYLRSKETVELTDADWEESLANHYVLKRLRNERLSNGSLAARAIRTVLSDSPEPYSNFALSLAERIEMEGSLAAGLINGMDAKASQALSLLTRDSSIVDSALGVLSESLRPPKPVHPIVGDESCPTYFVKTLGYAGKVLTFQGPTQKEFRSFITAYLDGKDDGFTDHQYYIIDNGKRVRFPNPHDKHIHTNEFDGILRSAGMLSSEFKKARQVTDRWKRKCPRNPVKPPITG